MKTFIFLALLIASPLCKSNDVIPDNIPDRSHSIVSELSETPSSESCFEIVSTQSETIIVESCFDVSYSFYVSSNTLNLPLEKHDSIEYSKLTIIDYYTFLSSANNPPDNRKVSKYGITCDNEEIKNRHSDFYVDGLILIDPGNKNPIQSDYKILPTVS